MIFSFERKPRLPRYGKRLTESSSHNFIAPKGKIFLMLLLVGVGITIKKLPATHLEAAVQNIAAAKQH